MQSSQEKDSEKKDPRKEYTFPKDLDHYISDTEKLLSKFRDTSNDPDEEDIKEEASYPTLQTKDINGKKEQETNSKDKTSLPERWRGPGPKPEPIRKRRIREQIDKHTQVLREYEGKVTGELEGGANVLRILTTNAKSIQHAGGKQRFTDAANFQKDQNKENKALLKKIQDFLKKVNDVLTEGRKTDPEDDEDNLTIKCPFPFISLPPFPSRMVVPPPDDLIPSRAINPMHPSSLSSPVIPPLKPITPHLFPSPEMQSAMPMGPLGIRKGPFGL